MKRPTVENRPCECGKCDRPLWQLSVYCAEHAETARQNVLRSLGLSAPSSLMWKDGDEDWLFSALVERRGGGS